MWRPFKKNRSKKENKTANLLLLEAQDKLELQGLRLDDQKFRLISKLKNLKEQYQTTNKELKKSLFELKGQLTQNNQERAVHLNAYVSTLQNELTNYETLAHTIENELLGVRKDQSRLNHQKESLATQLLLLPKDCPIESFSVEEFLDKIYTDALNATSEDNDLVNMEITLALENKESTHSIFNPFSTQQSATIHSIQEKQEKINQFFQNHHTPNNQTSSNKFSNFFTTDAEKEKQKKIDDFFNRKD
ncbi:hypothetical protein [Flammeovirga agarivorans]|uniref:Uncharacterized protein n=1 Tax=Flammeovirga agarivorans TaxID=2726742 RepID=A0A7X8SGU5_9BACT|nr:hypothetical protein [Flammeovirga agarivorans]NLR89950.1 hypothetical protein [Flammeovirga agarivorans]